MASRTSSTRRSNDEAKGYEFNKLGALIVYHFLHFHRAMWYACATNLFDDECCCRAVLELSIKVCERRARKKTAAAPRRVRVSVQPSR